jgi:hypothetical protein
MYEGCMRVHFPDLPPILWDSNVTSSISLLFLVSRVQRTVLGKNAVTWDEVSTAVYAVRIVSLLACGLALLSLVVHVAVAACKPAHYSSPWFVGLAPLTLVLAVIAAACAAMVWWLLTDSESWSCYLEVGAAGLLALSV